jgi:hypothetical protein
MLSEGACLWPSDVYRLERPESPHGELINDLFLAMSDSRNLNLLIRLFSSILRRSTCAVGFQLNRKNLPAFVINKIITWQKVS